MPLLTEYLFEKLTYENEEIVETHRRSKFWIRNALGNTVYIYKRDRKDAQEVVNEYFGKGRYTVNCN